MQNIKVSEGQSLMDIAVQYLGDVNRVFEIMELNDVELTDELEPGTPLLLPDEAHEKKHITSMYKVRNLFPASIDVEDIPELDEGIDFWIIEDDFVVQ